MARQSAAKEAANDTTRMELKTVVDNRTVGEILREARIARDEDYAEVSSQLRIRRTYMEAIEDGRFGDLPGSTYAIGFVRTYAEYLGLDVVKMVAKYKQEASDFEDRTRLVFPEPMPASRAPTASIIVVAIMLLFGSYAGWLYISNKDQDQIALVPPLPEALQNLIDGVESATPPVEETETVAQAPTAQEETAAAPPPASETPVAEEAQSIADSAPVTESRDAPVVVNETIASATPQAAGQPAETADVTATADSASQAAVDTDDTAAGSAVGAVEALADGEAAGIVTENAEATPPATLATPATTATTGDVGTAPVTADDTAADAEPATEIEQVVEAQTVAGIAPAEPSQPAAAPETAADTGTAATAPTALESEPALGAASLTEVETAGATVAEAPTAGTQTAETQIAATPPPETFAVPVPNAAEPTQYGDASAASRILIRSRSAAWVEITEPDGNVLLTRLLRPGDSFQVPDRPGITLVTGNAGGLEFLVDGAAAPAIGEIGDVRRDVLLEPNALLQGTAASQN